MMEFYKNRRRGQVYKLGGGKENSCSFLEGFEIGESCSGKKQQYRYVTECRIGDHLCNYSDLRKIKSHYPEWSISISLEEIILDLIEGWGKRVIM